jgi:hypothetical protein
MRWTFVGPAIPGKAGDPNGKTMEAECDTLLRLRLSLTLSPLQTSEDEDPIGALDLIDNKPKANIKEDKGAGAYEQ